MKTKTCSKCGKRLLVEKFRKDSSKRDGLYPSCNDCYRKGTGAKKLIHKIVGNYRGRKITHRNRYPVIIGISGRGQRVHRYLMEKHLGRKLQKTEHVHHKDGDVMNWELSNLVILQKNTHHQKHGCERKRALFKKWDKMKIVEKYKQCNSLRLVGRQVHACPQVIRKYLKTIIFNILRKEKQ